METRPGGNPRRPGAAALAVTIAVALAAAFAFAQLPLFAQTGKTAERDRLARELAERELALGPDHPDTLASMANLGLSFDGLNDYASMRDVFVKVADSSERTLGPDHPATLLSRNNLAKALFNLREFAAARDIFEQVAFARERTLGPDHADTLNSKHNLAIALDRLGEHSLARDIFGQVAAARERTLGPDHPATLGSKNSLANALYKLGEYAAARDIFGQVAAARERTLGNDHPSTLDTKNNLANALYELGEIAAARDIHEQAAAARERTLGPGHPATLTSRSNLAVMLDILGEHAAARDIHEQVAGARERTLGRDHPDTLSSRNFLGISLDHLGEFATARDVLADVAQASERVLGPDHLDTLSSKDSLATVHYNLGEYAASRDLHAAVAAARERVLGPGHPSTLASKNNLANVLGFLGEFATSRELLAQVAEAMARSLGPDHPLTLTSRNNLATALQDLGDFPAARDMFVQLADANERLLGPEHPHTLTSFHNLAGVLMHLGEYTRAREIISRNSGIRERVLGPDHPDTLDSKTNLAVTQNILGEFEGAKDLLASVLESAARNYGPDHPLAASAAAALGIIFGSHGDLEEAAFFLKLAVESAEKSRGQLDSLDVDLRRSYLRTVEESYYALIGILLRAGRAAEALAVLDLLKEDELRQLDPGAEDSKRRLSGPPGPPRAGAPPDAGAPREAGGPGPGAFPAPAAGDAGVEPQSGSSDAPGGESDGTRHGDAESELLFGGTADEAHRLSYREAALALRELWALRRELTAGRGAAELPDAEARLLAEAESGYAKASATLSGLCAGTWARRTPSLSGKEPPAVTGEASPASERLRQRQSALSSSGGGAAVLYAVSAKDALHLVAVTPGAVAVREAAVPREELARLVAEFRRELGNPASDPRPTAERLYDAVVGPVADALKAEGTSTLLLSLDGPLRYAPAAAFWDGGGWLVEGMSVALFTRSTAALMAAGAEAGRPPALASAFGVTGSMRGLPALPGVKEEIEAVVGSGGSPGVLSGEGTLDAAFDRAALARGLGSGAPVVHVASHFVLDPSSLEGSLLVLGDGGALSLREIRESPDLDFGGLDLLTLSACETGAGSGARRDGREVESLGEIVQRAGASAVLASLLRVDDASAPSLMREFYRLRYVEGLGKAESLRGAQLSVMRGEGAGPAGERGTPVSGAGPARTRSAASGWEGGGFSHPYFWAPFVVMGDWR